MIASGVLLSQCRSTNGHMACIRAPMPDDAIQYELHSSRGKGRMLAFVVI